jgi:hypothetical protein
LKINNKCIINIGMPEQWGSYYWRPDDSEGIAPIYHIVIRNDKNNEGLDLLMCSNFSQPIVVPSTFKLRFPY